MIAEQAVARAAMDRVAVRSMGSSPPLFFLTLAHTVVHGCEEVALRRGWLDWRLPPAQRVSVKAARRHSNSILWRFKQRCAGLSRTVRQNTEGGVINLYSSRTAADVRAYRRALGFAVLFLWQTTNNTTTAAMVAPVTRRLAQRAQNRRQEHVRSSCFEPLRDPLSCSKKQNC